MEKSRKIHRLKRRWAIEREMWLWAVIPVMWALVFCYAPMYGLVISFTKYTPGQIIGSGDWVGLKYFRQFFSNPDFPMLLRNTFVISFLNILFGFPAPIILALLLNELRGGPFKKFMQTAYYLPHFISWVVTASLFFSLLSSEGVVNTILIKLGFIDSGVNYLGKGSYFWTIITVANIWKSMGWSSILYLSAIAGVDEELYQAGAVDGLGRLGMVVHITLPGIMSTIALMFILRFGDILNAGFEQQLLLGTEQTRSYYEVIDTFAYRYGIQLGRYSFGTAVALVKSVCSLMLVFLANTLVRKMTDLSLL